MRQRRIEWVVVYSVKKQPDQIRHDAQPPYLAGATVICEERLNKGGIITNVGNDEEAKKLFDDWRANIEKRVNLNGDILTAEPKLLKRIITEVILA